MKCRQMPAYQRLRQWHQGKAIDLLCFVNSPGEKVKQLLGECGAFPSKLFRAECFAEVWEMSHDDLVRGRFTAEPSQFDQEVSKAMGCGDGKLSAAAGLMEWGDHQEEEHRRRQVRSRLLDETLSKRSAMRSSSSANSRVFSNRPVILTAIMGTAKQNSKATAPTRAQQQQGRSYLTSLPSPLPPNDGARRRTTTAGLPQAIPRRGKAERQP